MTSKDQKKYHKQRSKLLGLNVGTATHKLKKAIMFDMAEKLGILTCFRCQQQISTVEDLTVDHKEAWQRANNPQEAFFSLENIAFSHPNCNVRAGIRYRKYATKEEAKKAKAAQHRSPKYRAKSRLWKQKRRAEQKLLGLKVT